MAECGTCGRVLDSEGNCIYCDGDGWQDEDGDVWQPKEGEPT